MAGLVGALRISLGLDTASFERDTRKAMSSTDKLRSGMMKAGAGIAGAFAGISIMGAVNSWRDQSLAALDAAGSLGEVAAQLGVTTKSMQEYRYIASQVGISNEQMDKTLSILTRRMGEAADGAKKPREAFKDLGISMADIKGKDAGDVLQMMAAALERIPDVAERARLQTTILGKSGQVMGSLFAEGAEGIRKMRDEAHNYGMVISEEVIKNSDATADSLGRMMKMVEMQKNAMLVQPENVKAVAAYAKTMAELEVGFIKAIGQFSIWAERHKLWETDILPGLRKFNEWNNVSVRDMENAANAILQSIRRLVTGIKDWMGARLNEVWNGVTSKVQAVADKFRWLQDVVVGNSYVPDMVDAIGAHMGRLDQLMVDKAGKVTEATAEKFRNLREVLDRLFPEAVERRGYDADIAAITAKDSGLTDEQKRVASQRAWASRFGGSPMAGPDIGGAEPLIGSFRKTEEAIESLTQKAKDNTVRIAESFKQMAEATMGALTKLTSAIKGGGFLGILEAVIGLGLQLGSIGAFGKGVAQRLNATASGGGQKAPALGGVLTVRLEKDGGFTGHVEGIAARVIGQSAPGIMQGSANLSSAQAARSAKWSLAA